MISLEERLLRRSTADGDCLRWTGAHTESGYGRIHVDRSGKPVHRAAYELWVGPIPPGLQVDHVRDRGCRFRDCFRPDHLEVVTLLENIQRGHSFRQSKPSEATCDHLLGVQAERRYVCNACRQVVEECDLCGLRFLQQNMRRHRQRRHDEAKAARRKIEHERAVQVRLATAPHSLRKTACKRGHPFDEVNTSWTSRGERRCLRCHAEATRRSRALRSELAGVNAA